MNQVSAVCPKDTKFEGNILDTITLDFDSRRRRRIKLTTDSGIEFLLNLQEVKTLRDGDILPLDDGSGVLVRAKDEPVADIRSLNLAHLVRIAWHLGNRHLPTELMADRMRIRQDHVIEEMLVKLGAIVERLEAPFNPEGGAYGHGETEGHDHGPSHGHSHG